MPKKILKAILITDNSSNAVIDTSNTLITDITNLDEYEEESNLYNLFTPEMPENNTWLLNRNKLINEIKGKIIHFPFVIDTEFTTKSTKEWIQINRKHITTQIKGIHALAPSRIYVNKTLRKKINEARKTKNLKTLKSCGREAHFIDYLEKECGYKIKVTSIIHKKELHNQKKFIATVYAHFATAELNLIFENSLKERVKELQRSQGNERIEHGRRTRCVTVIDGQEIDYVELNHFIWINDEKYSLCLRIIDTGAIHGVASYADFCKASGWVLKHKDKLSKSEKKNMIDTAINKPLEFEQYSLGDLDVYEALEAFHTKWQEIYELLGISSKYTVPKLTIGGTVKDLFIAALAQSLGIEGEKWIDEFREFTDNFLKDSSAGELRKDSKHTSALLAKVEGGRCRNNRPTDIFITRKVKGKFDAVLICDIDISGCYGEGQRNQLYLIGKPEILSFKVTNKNNRYPSLREWLESYDVKIDEIIKSVINNDFDSFQNADLWGELVPGCWHLRMSTFKDLKYPQDFFASWFTNSGNGVKLMAKFVNQMKCDSEFLITEHVDFDETEGNLKIFNHQIHNGVLTHDGLEWIFAICSKRQRNELLDNLHVLTSMVYPKSSRIEEGETSENYKELLKSNENWKGETYAERITNPTTGKKSWRIHDGECHSWFGVNLGELLINELLINRKQSQNKYGKKSPLDLLFKLGVNTLFGDMVSKYFAVANTCTGNNITARARLLCWCMEKGLHGHQSITDGCAFEPTGVLFAGRDKIDGECINLHRNKSKLNKRMIRKGNLTDAKKILGYWEEFTFKIWNDEKKKGVEKTINLFGLIIDKENLKPFLIEDSQHEGCSIPVQPAMKWIDDKAMEHLRSTFPLISVLHRKTTEIKIDNNLKVEFKERLGQFSFETKDVYYEGGFHGSANYILKKPTDETIKARGYEVKKEHVSISNNNKNYEVTERYNEGNSPAKDFMNQVSSTPEKIKRQDVAIKSGILKIGDYKNLPDKYDSLGLEPGDNILKIFLMGECSLSQFTFQTYEQWKNWNDSHLKSKDKNKQSLELYFLNEDGSLNLQLMSEEIDRAIENGITKPNKHFDKSMNRHRKGLEHPQKPNFDAIRDKLAGFEQNDK